MKPLQKSKNPSARTYPTEYSESCSVDKLNGYKKDGRYLSLGMPTTEWDVQNPSGVIYTLAHRPLSSLSFYPNIVTVKMDAKTGFWARPTI